MSARNAGVVVHPSVWAIVKKLHDCDTDTQLAKLIGIHRASLYRYFSGAPVAARIILTLSQLTGLPADAIATPKTTPAGQKPVSRPTPRVGVRRPQGLAA